MVAQPIEHELWVNRTGCPHCGKKINLEVEEDSAAAENYYASFPKKPPRLDWFVMPFVAILAAPLPIAKWALAGIDPETFDTTAILRDAGISAAIGAVIAYGYYRAKRKCADNDRQVRLLRQGLVAFLLLSAALYVTR